MFLIACGSDPFYVNVLPLGLSEDRSQGHKTGTPPWREPRLLRRGSSVGNESGGFMWPEWKRGRHSEALKADDEDEIVELSSNAKAFRAREAERQRGREAERQRGREAENW